MSRTLKSALPRKKESKIPQKPFIDHFDLPSNYGTTSVTLIARDPNWIYAYWEISPNAIEELHNTAGDQIDSAARVLRMYDVTMIDFNGSNANHWFDIEVGHSSNWYINLWMDNTSYCADLGLRLSDGRFFSLCRSNTATLPRKAQSWRSEQVWMEVKDDPVKSPKSFVIGNIHKVNENRNQPAKEGSSRQEKKRKIYLNDDDIRQYYSRLSPLLKDIISLRLSRKGTRGLGTSVGEKRKVTLDEFRQSGLTWEHFLKKILSGASEELVITEKGGAGAGASENFMGASEQGASVQPPKKRTFFFEIGTELIVYGRTEPDAEVWLGNKKISLRPDGTFTLRFALPDGNIPLDFTAVSNDKVEQRKISTSVERSKTKYNP